MKQLVEQIITQSTGSFIFKAGQEDPNQHLRDVTNSIPDTMPGFYLVFTDGELYPKEVHLLYTINGNLYTLCYFGKGGGFKKNGSGNRTQQLRARLNNVVSDSSRDIKDMKRARYWKRLLNEYNKNELLIIYKEHVKPYELEDEIYDYLKREKLLYPFMNKKQGKKKKS